MGERWEGGEERGGGEERVRCPLKEDSGTVMRTQLQCTKVT